MRRNLLFIIAYHYNFEFVHTFSVDYDCSPSLKSHLSSIATYSKGTVFRNSVCSEDNTDGESLLSWVEDHEEGFVGPLTIGPSKIGYGRGLFVSESVRAGDVLCEIPNDNCLSMEQTWEDDDLISLYVDEEDWIVMLSAKVSKEYLCQEQSYWLPYLRELNWKKDPTQHVLWWDDEEIVKLKKQYGQEAFDTAIEWRAQVNHICEFISSNISKMNKSFQKVNMEELKQIVRASLIHIYSRAFQDEPHEYQKLIPLLDMMQHTFDENMVNVDHETDYDTGNVIVTASKDLTIGEELCFQYGSCESSSVDHDEKDAIQDNGDKMKDYLFYFMYGFHP